MSNENSSPNSSGLSAFAEELEDHKPVADPTALKQLSEALEDVEVSSDSTPTVDVADDLSDTVLDSTAEEELGVAETATLEIFKKKCLNCVTLVSWGTEDYKSCHFTNGNEYCPGSSVAIVVRVPQEKIDDAASKIFSAMKTQDTTRLARLYAQLDGCSEHLKSKVFARVQEMQLR